MVAAAAAGLVAPARAGVPVKAGEVVATVVRVPPNPAPRRAAKDSVMVSAGAVGSDFGEDARDRAG